MSFHHPNIRIITSPANEEIKDIRALERRKERRETGLFIAEGLRHTLEGIANGWELARLVYHSKVAGKNEVINASRACIAGGGMCFEVNDTVLEKLSHKDNPQQVIGVFKQRMTALEELPQKKCIVALEQVRDPGNLGTILRTVDSIGADGVILDIPKTSSFYRKSHGPADPAQEFDLFARQAVERTRRARGLEGIPGLSLEP